VRGPQFQLRLVKGPSVTQHWNTKGLLGQRFGKLLVLKDAGVTAHREHAWLCQCDCGKQVTRVGGVLRGKKSTSCGCGAFTPESNARRAPKPKPGAALRRAYGACIRAAKVRRLSFTLTLVEFAEITAKPCFYCGDLPAQRKYSTFEAYLANGIDRRDNNFGYERANCVPCCFPCNDMKGALGQERFLAQALKIAGQHGGAIFQLSAVPKDA
jgi:hypothetical protein